MKSRCPIRPCLQHLEGRIVLSFSLANFLNSMIPGIIKPQTHHVAHASAPKAKPVAHPRPHPQVVAHHPHARVPAPAHPLGVHALPAHAAHHPRKG